MLTIPVCADGVHVVYLLGIVFTVPSDDCLLAKVTGYDWIDYIPLNV
jgi:hypothetical protein